METRVYFIEYALVLDVARRRPDTRPIMVMVKWQADLGLPALQSRLVGSEAVVEEAVVEGQEMRNTSRR